MPRLMTERQFWKTAAEFFSVRAAMPPAARRADVLEKGNWGFCRLLDQNSHRMSGRAIRCVARKIEVLLGPRRAWAFRCSKAGDLQRVEYAKKQVRRKS